MNTTKTNLCILTNLNMYTEENIVICFINNQSTQHNFNYKCTNQLRFPHIREINKVMNTV